MTEHAKFNENLMQKSYYWNMENKIVLTYGTFDLLHYGHIELLRRAKELGNYLIVGLSTDEFNQIKQKQSYFDFAKRKELLQAVNYVDLIIAEESWDQKRNDIIRNNVDIFVMGDDWANKFDDLQDVCTVKYFERTPLISSTLIKGIYQSI